jgi:hypothetical protein
LLRDGDARQREQRAHHDRGQQPQCGHAEAGVWWRRGDRRRCIDDGQSCQQPTGPVCPTIGCKCPLA